MARVRRSRRMLGWLHGKQEQPEGVMITYRIYGKMPHGGWGRIGRNMSFDTRAEAEMVCERYRQEYSDNTFEVREHRR